MKYPNLISLSTMILALPTLALAETWTGITADRRPKGRSDIDFAVSELCFAYLLSDRLAVDVIKRKGVLKKSWDSKKPGYLFFDEVWVGGPYMIVTFSDNGLTRDCTIRATKGDPGTLRAALDERLTQWPVPLTPGLYQYPANLYETREFLCGPKVEPHDTVLISKGSKVTPLMVSFSRSIRRSERCDGVPPPADYPLH